MGSEGHHVMKSRVTLAVVGMLLIGTLGAVGGVMSAQRALPAALGSAQTSNTAGGGGSSVRSAAAAATSTALAPGSAPTATPTNGVLPTATPQQPNLRGTIVTIGANSLTISQAGGASATVEVNGSTQFQGVATSFGALRTGMRVLVTGQSLPNGDFLAASIDAQNADN